MSEERMESGSLDLRSLVDGLPHDDLDELRDAVASRLCREKHGADTMEGLLARWGHEPACPACGSEGAWPDGHAPPGRVRCRCRSCGERLSALSGTVFANAKPPPHKVMGVVGVMCRNASPRLVESVCEVSHSTAFPWRRKAFPTVGGRQDGAVLSGRAWIDETCFEDTRVERDPGKPGRRGLPEDEACAVVAIDSQKRALAVASESGKPSTKGIDGALRRRVRKGPAIVHDRERAHDALVRDLELVDERHKAVATDPVCLERMALVNHLCSWIRRYAERFACMRSENLRAYLDWLVYLHRVHGDEKRWPVEERVARHLALSNSTYLRKW